MNGAVLATAVLVAGASYVLGSALFAVVDGVRWAKILNRRTEAWMKHGQGTPAELLDMGHVVAGKQRRVILGGRAVEFREHAAKHFDALAGEYTATMYRRAFARALRIDPDRVTATEQRGPGRQLAVVTIAVQARAPNDRELDELDIVAELFLERYRPSALTGIVVLEPGGIVDSRQGTAS